MKTLAALLASLALTACTAAAPRSAPPPQVVAAADGTLVPLGQAVQVGSLVVTPLEVNEDSRCPMNARCVWAGRVVLVARIAGAGWEETTPLTLGLTHGTHGLSLTLTSVTPEKTTTDPLAPGDYRFGFEGGH